MFNQLLIFIEQFLPLPGFEPWADMLPTELSWLGYFFLLPELISRALGQYAKILA